MNNWAKLIMMFTMMLTMCVSGQLAFAETSERTSGQTLMAILPLQGQATPGFGDLSDSIYQRVMTALFKTKRFEFVERAQLATVLGEAKLQHSGLFDERSAVKLGKQLGVSTVVVGSYKAAMSKQYLNNGVVLYPADIELNLRFVNAKTGKVENLVKAAVSGNADNIMDKLSNKLEREVSNLYALRGYIIKVLNEKEAVIDLGSKDGLTEGNEFNVIEYGEDIVHPKTKKIIKGEKKLINEVEVTNLSEETAVVKITGNAQKPIKVGEEVESKPKKAGFWESLRESIK